MICLYCNSPLKRGRRINMETRTILYEYYHCELCNNDFDADKNEMIRQGDKFTLVKDTINPPS